MPVYAYARVSSADQTLDPQVDQLVAAGVSREAIFSDAATSGTTRGSDRPGYAALCARLAPGDVVVVVRLDRLGRSVVDVLQQVEALTARGVVVRSLAEGVDSSTPAGRMLLGVMASLAAYERELTRERQAAGIASAKARGKHLGRPAALTVDDRAEARALHAAGTSLREIARRLRVGKATVQRALDLA